MILVRVHVLDGELLLTSCVVKLRGNSACGISGQPEIVIFFLHKVILIPGPSRLVPGDFPEGFGGVGIVLLWCSYILACSEDLWF